MYICVGQDNGALYSHILNYTVERILQCMEKDFNLLPLLKELQQRLSNTTMSGKYADNATKTGKKNTLTPNTPNCKMFTLYRWN